MIKTRAIIEVEVKGRIAQLECPIEFTWDDVLQALACINEIAQSNIKSLQDKQVKEEKKEEEVKEDE